MNDELQITTATSSELEDIPITVIRTETVLSKLPIHHLAKKGNIDISIIQKNTDGSLDLKWEVTYANRYGRPGQLAYKLDTLVINRRIDETGRPLPRYICLGSLRDIARELGLGGNTQKVKKALRQNAGAFISARLTYRRAADRSQKTLEADFTRYGVIFTGEKLPDGRKADAVYVTFNEPYREVLNNASVRPLDYDYLKHLAPAPQRFYEILSYRVFAALKNRRTEARLSYAEYCTFSAQQRYTEYEPFRKQMYKIHRPHLLSGYLANIRYVETSDDEGKPDWDMFYEPGPKARAEYRSFTGDKQRVVDTAPVLSAGGETTNDIPERRSPPRQRRFNLQPPAQQNLSFNTTEKEPDPAATHALSELTNRGVGAGKTAELIADFGQWGIGETDARALLAAASPEQPVRDQLDYCIFRIKQGGITKPDGFIIDTIRKNKAIPSNFETRAKRQERQLAREAKEREAALRYEREESYRAGNDAAVDRHIAQHLRPEDLKRLVDEQVRLLRKERWYGNLPPTTIQETAVRKVRQAIAQELKLPTFEEYCAMLDRGAVVSES